METCKHCGQNIKHYGGRLWHGESMVFPQYCNAKYDDAGELLPSRLHEPAPAPV